MHVTGWQSASTANCVVGDAPEWGRTSSSTHPGSPSRRHTAYCAVSGVDRETVVSAMLEALKEIPLEQLEAVLRSRRESDE